VWREERSTKTNKRKRKRKGISRDHSTRDINLRNKEKNRLLTPFIKPKFISCDIFLSIPK
jgi:hypothetical protein